MTYHEPITIAGETFEPVPVACPSCDAEIDAGDGQVVALAKEEIEEKEQ